MIAVTRLEVAVKKLWIDYVNIMHGRYSLLVLILLILILAFYVNYHLWCAFQKSFFVFYLNVDTIDFYYL